VIFGVGCEKKIKFDVDCSWRQIQEVEIEVVIRREKDRYIFRCKTSFIPLLELGSFPLIR